ncbi:MAG: CDGSH iron-sulfur domain-containing protein [Pseudonocardiales bacterium]|nr:CDGSH iron-sulfur domain-containing protein [Pseudonocardiales bacterium]
MTSPTDETPDLVFVDGGPLLVRGPVVVELPDGRRVRSDRPVSALCVCRRSRRAPFCDTSHRTRVRAGDDGRPGEGAR